MSGIALVGYALTSLAVGRGDLVLPLDDVYIHFQYARQAANGQPYEYNPGLPPSSGATSLLYPFLLAVGASLEGLSLGWWALTIGTLSLLAGAWTIALLVRLIDTAPPWLPLLMGGLYVLTGPVAWHAMSGMETALVTALLLITLYSTVSLRFWVGAAAASLLAIVRPEGSLFAVLAAGVFVLQQWRRIPPWEWLYAGVPVLLVGLQPLVNLFFTGSATAAGNSAKSILSSIPPDANAMATQILGNFTRMWTEFATGYSPREGLYLPIPLFALATVGWLMLLRRRPFVGLLVFGWLLAGTASISTLDPAFWHFKRYQMPLMALLFPLAGWGLAFISRWRPVALGLGVVLMASAVWTSVRFVQHYALNSANVSIQQLPMARWVADNTPADAVIAVHDVGMLRYMGDRTTVDIVGLTTPGAALSWRNGPGAVAEFLGGYEPRPTHVAAYTDALSFSYLAGTDLYAVPLMAFPATLSDRFNVALAGAYQGVWRIDWTAFELAAQPHSSILQEHLIGASLDALNVANLESEAAHAYAWNVLTRRPGFPSEVYQQNTLFCDENCTVMDGGRRFDGEETFTMTVDEADVPLMLVSRVHPAFAGEIDIYVNDTLLDTHVIPAIPGGWLELATPIPSRVATDVMHVRIVPHITDGVYMPYYHWLYEAPEQNVPEGSAVATFQAGGFWLGAANTTIAESRLTLDLLWATDGTAIGDYRLFVHLVEDLTSPPVAQVDTYTRGGPPGNWLRGDFSDTIVVDLGAIEPGSYTLLLGFYDPATGTRATVTPAGPDNRLLLGTVEVE